LNLNIEEDARILRERLNICEEAVDIFRASSSLLKAGVQAGLTLYDIAIMCCRNDNLGEKPSKLEILCSMASELAVVAVDNAKFHHSAASRALAEQLSPHPLKGVVPRLSFGRRDSHRMSKSVSSGEFLSLEALAKETEAAVPSMAHSSASDTSSDNDEPGDCEKWAAAVIADHQFAVTPEEERRRSLSDASSTDSILSGFWTVRPGCQTAEQDDDDSVSWSVESSPPMAKPIVTFSPGVLASAVKTCLSSFKDSKYLSRPSVTFAPEPPPKAEETFEPLAIESEGVADDSAEETTPNNQDTSRMTRSRSQPLLTRSLSGVTTSSSLEHETDTPSMAVSLSSHRRHAPSWPIEYDHYRKYYHKFVDLVIIRETSAAVHRSLSRIGTP
jgi:hypothetical protein